MEQRGRPSHAAFSLLSLLPPVQMRLLFTRDSVLVFLNRRRKQRGGTSHAAVSQSPQSPLFPLLTRIPVAPFSEFNGRHYFFRYWIVVVPIVPLNSNGARS